jgi:hypothetical protein
MKRKETNSGRWLKKTARSELVSLRKDELKDLHLLYVRCAQEQYRAACKVADKNKTLKKQLEMRQNMSLMEYEAKEYLEAQLYAMSTIHLTNRNSQHLQYQDLLQAKRILDKV